jgi:alkanesulfonate monooxygenase SsuD/methylene tetrahydromethanopterin reductase-like flavin-dependent oxidoreductase (luciferase family)
MNAPQRRPTFGLWYDFRNPVEGRTNESFYAATLEQIAWAEGLGFESVWLSEHHFCDDSYTPSPLVLAAAIAARTRTLRIGTSLILLPLHDPIRIAEDAATLAVLSQGRFLLGVGQGYREIEYEAFGRHLRQRPSLLEESVEILRRAWSGAAVNFTGKRFSVPAVRVTPVAARTPPLLIGGMSAPAIDRVARLADGFLSTNNEHHLQYLEAFARSTRPPSEAAIYAGQWVIIDDDPERTWARIGDCALYQLNQYIEWGAFGPPASTPRFPDRQAILAAGAYQLWDVPTAIDRITAMVRARPQIRDVHFWAQLPGESVESGSRRIELLAKRVLPEVRRRLAEVETQPTA